VTRNDSSIVAFKLGRHSPLQGGIRLVGAHTDSPCLRVKPQPELQRQGFWQLGVEVYGGALLAPGSTVTCPWPAASPSAATARSKAS
jgi:aspartyl aminopeptidase